jgi:hypothetical protein
VIIAGSRKARLRQAACNRAEALAVAAPTSPRLEVPDTLVASNVDAANEHLAVIRAGMSAPVAERQVLALGADLVSACSARWLSSGTLRSRITVEEEDETAGQCNARMARFAETVPELDQQIFPVK